MRIVLIIVGFLSLAFSAMTAMGMTAMGPSDIELGMAVTSFIGAFVLFVLASILKQIRKQSATADS